MAEANHFSNLSRMSKSLNRKKLKFVLQHLVCGFTLDAGCGNGLYGLEIFDKVPALSQCDIVDRRNEEARFLNFFPVDLNMLNKLDASYSNIIALDVIEHLDDDIRFLCAVREHCTGRLILSVPNEDDSQLQPLNLTYVHHKDKSHRRQYSLESLTQTLHEGGFRVIEIKTNYTSGLINAPIALAKDNFFSRTYARFIKLQIMVAEKIGLFENRCIGDWFCAAEPE